jgi:hypothetical protein
MWNVVVMDGTEQQKFKGISTLNFIRRKRNLTSNPKFWERPATGWVKCNVDAAFYDGDRSAASGVVLRDQDGRTCGGTAKWYEYCLNALAAEVLACCDGMQLAREQGVRRLILETDCQVLTGLWRILAGALKPLVKVSLAEIIIS